MSNSAFCADWVLDRAKTGSGTHVLDFGCGAGQVVSMLRSKGVSAFGCDVFYEGGDYSKQIPSSWLSAGIIRRMENEIIPFEDASFDLIVHNMVMEHVRDLDHAVQEIGRVLKPGGYVLNLFPDKGVWREGHCGVPFLHWFAKGGGLRVYYAAGFAMVGLGYHRNGKAVMEWARDFCAWLDAWTHYRPWSEIESTYRKYFSDLTPLEDQWLAKRLGTRTKMATSIPKAAQQVIVRKLATRVFMAQKPV